MEPMADTGPDYDQINEDVGHLILLVLGCMVATLFLWQMIVLYTAHLRKLASFNGSTQKYFLRAYKSWALLKKHLLYAPLFQRLHSRGLQIKSLNFGVLPKRFHILLILGLVAMNAILLVVAVPFGSSLYEYANVLQDRSGSIAVVNLIPLVILAGRNNLLIVTTRVPFDTWNLFHRWLARIVVAEAGIHAISWIIPVLKQGGYRGFQKQVQGNVHNISGLLAVSAAVALVLHSSPVLRRASYELFHYAHILVVVTFLVGLWIHLKDYPQLVYIVAAVALWGADRIIRLLVIVYRNIGHGGTTAYVEVLPGDALRITLSMARPWAFKPGQHLFLSIPSVGFWTSHPFSVAWSESKAPLLTQKALMLSQSGETLPELSPISLIVRRQKGFTDKLYRKVASRTLGTANFNAYVQGPFGGLQSLDSYGTVILFAGGVGVTHMTAYLQHLVAGHANGTVALRRLTLIWTVQSWDHLEWIRPWMKTIIEMERAADLLQVQIHVSRPETSQEVRNRNSNLIKMNLGRPNVGETLDLGISQQVGAMAVMVCGPGSLSDEVRYQCCLRQRMSNIDFFEESFSW